MLAYLRTQGMQFFRRRFAGIDPGFDRFETWHGDEGQHTRRPSVAMVCINFAPELTGIGVYATGIADYLSSCGYRVRVHTAFPYYPHWSKRAEDRHKLYRDESLRGMHIRRSYVYVPQKPSVLRRIFHELSFVCSATLGYIASPRADITLVVAPPLLLGIPIAVCAWLRRSRTIFHVQDLQPDAAVDLGMMRDGLMVRTLFRIEKLTYRLVDAVGGISAAMLERIRAKGIPARKLLLLPNWANDDLVRPLSSQTRFRAAWGLERRFVVLYSGNMGVKQGLPTVLEAAQLLQGNPDIQFVLVGDGGEKRELQARAAELGLSNVQFHPLQKKEDLAELLATADVAVVPQRPGVTDIVLPSKISNVMCSARPMVVAAQPGTELYRIVNDAQCGLIVRPGDAAALAHALRSMQERPEALAQMGVNGRNYAADKLAAASILGGFERWLRDWLADSEARSRVTSQP
jgi:colanic acid biosynthesis glycosyl transferase WcaI